MTPFNDRLEERSYFVPKRVGLALLVVGYIAKEEIVTIEQLMSLTGYSRAYLKACCQGLKRYGVLNSKRGVNGGYWLTNGTDTTVGDVVEATSRSEDRSFVTRKYHNFLIGKSKDLKIGEIMDDDFLKDD